MGTDTAGEGGTMTSEEADVNTDGGTKDIIGADNVAAANAHITSAGTMPAQGADAASMAGDAGVGAGTDSTATAVVCEDTAAADNTGAGTGDEGSTDSAGEMDTDTGEAGSKDTTQASTGGAAEAQTDTNEDTAGACEAALPKSDHEKQAAARTFALRWKGKGESEIGETQLFWTTLLQTVFGVKTEDLPNIIKFEKPVYVDGQSLRIDGFITLTSLMGTSRILIEQKKRNVYLGSKEKQSDGSLLTPFEQGKRYADWLGEESPRWIVTCNFREFWVYDMKKPSKELGKDPEVVSLKDFESEWYRLAFLADAQKEVEKRQEAASRLTGSLIGGLYDLLLAKCLEPQNPDTLKSLNIFCVRLVFCFYAEDTGLFGDEKTLFDEYVRSFNPEHLRDGLKKLFVALDTPKERRDRYDKQIAAFPYADGGLFADHTIEIPYIDGDVKAMILECGKADWSDIDPVIFGSIFESTLNPQTRRTGGMHYTAPGNIDRVLDPLFMNDLTRELEAIKRIDGRNARLASLRDFQRKIASLKFLDPACGSGNFLTQTYTRLRRLENDAIEAMMGCPVDEERKQGVFADESFNPVKVSLAQFWGIEINDFAVSVAKTALWIAERQMLQATERIVGRGMDFLPISTQTHIAEGNALQLDWGTMEGARAGLTVEDTLFADVGEGEQLSFDYIMGNPPFVGYSFQSDAQKADILHVFGEGWKNAGALDYVACWYKKAVTFIEGTDTRCAFVSTNSITQGEQVVNLWKPLFAQGLHIDFAWRSFRWQQDQSEEEAGESDEQAAEQLAASKDKRKAKSKEEREFKKRHKVAAVYCVVVGFSCAESDKPKMIYEERVVQTADGKKQSERVATVAHNINGYLMDAPCVFIERRECPICEGVPAMTKGSQPTDGGNFYLTDEERKAAVKKTPGIAKFIKRVVGSEEFINGKTRWCLWLVGASPQQIKSSAFLKGRVKAVQQFRLKSKKKATQDDAASPALFQEIRQPTSDYVIVPSVSSADRYYVPMGYLTPETICTNLAFVIPDATLYHFGVLTSSVHMAWMRAVCGRLGMGYRYSNTIVYNNFVWPKATDQQRAQISQTAQAILAARDAYPDSSLAALYDETTMPHPLRRAHEANDRAVLAAYGWSADMSEADIVSHLMELYQQKAGA